MENEILLYTDETGKMNVNVRFAEEDVLGNTGSACRNLCNNKTEYRTAH